MTIKTFSNSTKTVFIILSMVAWCLLWLWFGFQYGFNNSPDSWHRGVLAKSILEGHPLFINFMQGWVYDYPLWHYSASHEPLLPVIYAIYFYFFGIDIKIANLVSCTSAALLLLPLIGISKKTLRSIWPGLGVYLLLVANEETSFLWEVTAGLSIPTSSLLLCSALLGTLFVLEKEHPVLRFGTTIVWVLFFYSRGPEQLIFLWTMLWTLIITYKVLPGETFKRLRWMWTSSFLLVLPSLLRKFWLFGNPLFTDQAPAAWSDRGYDYFSYHESIPYPSPKTYFATHTTVDFFKKFVIGGVDNFYKTLNAITVGPAWIYLFIALVSLTYLLIKNKAVYQRVWLLITLAVFVGYFGIYCVSPVLDHRYFIPVYILLMLYPLCAGGMIIECFIHTPWRRSGTQAVATLGILFALHSSFLSNFSTKYLIERYYDGNSYVLEDKDMQQLKKKLAHATAVLGPFAGVQQLSFATGINLIEQPDNLINLLQPVEFFKRYKIQYSLIDVSKVLPGYMIPHRELIGKDIVYTIDYNAKPTSAPLATFPTSSARSKPFGEAVVFIDTFHGTSVTPCFFNVTHTFKKLHATGKDYVESRNVLLSSDILILRFGIREFSPPELAVLTEFIDGGGRILVMSHGWVWTSYKGASLESLPANQIAQPFGAIVSASMSGAPFTSKSKTFKLDGVANKLAIQGSTFSNVSLDNKTPSEVVLQDHDLLPIAAALIHNKARLFVWGHDHLLEDDFACTEDTAPFVESVFTWLLESK